MQVMQARTPVPFQGARDYILISSAAGNLSDTVPILGDNNQCLQGFIVATAGTINIKLLDSNGNIRSLPATACPAGTEFRAYITHVCTNTTAVIYGIV